MVSEKVLVWVVTESTSAPDVAVFELSNNDCPYFYDYTCEASYSLNPFYPIRVTHWMEIEAPK